MSKQGPRRKVLKSWPALGWVWAVGCKLECGHTCQASYRKGKEPKTVACYKCRAEAMKEQTP